MEEPIKYYLADKHKEQVIHHWETDNEISEAMATIESEDFAIALGVASRLETFMDGIRDHDAVLLLAEESQARSTLNEVTGRFFELLLTKSNGVFDTALTVYLWIIGEHNQVLAERIAESITGIGSGNWWLLRLVNKVRLRLINKQ